MLFTLEYDPRTGETKYISTLPLDTVLLLVNQLIATEAVKKALDEVEKKKSEEKQSIVHKAMDIAAGEESG